MKITIIEGPHEKINKLETELLSLLEDSKSIEFESFFQEKESYTCKNLIVKGSFCRILKNYPERIKDFLSNDNLNEKRLFGDFFIQFLSPEDDLPNLEQVILSKYFKIKEGKFVQDLKAIVNQINAC
jgi:hypothetical protein